MIAKDSNSSKASHFKFNHYVESVFVIFMFSFPGFTQNKDAASKMKHSTIFLIFLVMVASFAAQKSSVSAFDVDYFFEKMEDCRNEWWNGYSSSTVEDCIWDQWISAGGWD